MYLEWDLFLNAIAELEAHYNKSLTDFAKKAWYEKLKRLTESQLYAATVNAITDHNFMPTAQQLLDMGGAYNGNPGENWVGQQSVTTDYLALPSTEINVANLTPEQVQANIEKAREMAVRYRDSRSRLKWTRTSKVLEAEKYTTAIREAKKTQEPDADPIGDELVLKEMQIYLQSYLKTFNSALLDSIESRIKAEPDKFEMVLDGHGQPADVRFQGDPILTALNAHSGCPRREVCAISEPDGS